MLRRLPTLMALALVTSAIVLVALPAGGQSETCPGYSTDTREQVVGSEDDDVLFVPEGGIGCGLGGDDVLRADSQGETLLSGGDGDDVLCAENRDFDRLFGGDGHDRARRDEEDKLREVESDVVVIACTRP